MAGPYGTWAPHVVSVTTTATQLSNVGARQVVFQNSPASTGRVYIGGSTLAQPSTGVMVVLDAGMSISLDASNLDAFYVQSASGTQTLFATTAT